MTRNEKKLVDECAAVLNGRLDKGQQINDETVEIVNEMLENIAGGARLVTARETDNTLVGFVPKYHIPTQIAKTSPPATAFGGDEPKQT